MSRPAPLGRAADRARAGGRTDEASLRRRRCPLEVDRRCVMAQNASSVMSTIHLGISPPVCARARYSVRLTELRLSERNRKLVKNEQEPKGRIGLADLLEYLKKCIKNESGSPILTVSAMAFLFSRN